MRPSCRTRAVEGSATSAFMEAAPILQKTDQLHGKKCSTQRQVLFLSVVVGTVYISGSETMSENRMDGR